MPANIDGLRINRFIMFIFGEHLNDPLVGHDTTRSSLKAVKASYKDQVRWEI
jgi:hypothetical protein